MTMFTRNMGLGRLCRTEMVLETRLEVVDIVGVRGQ